MVAVNKVVDEHVFRYRTEGVEQTRAQADALAKSQGNLAKSSEGVAASSAGAERSARGASDAYGGLSARSEAAAKMAAALERAQRQADAAMAQATMEANALQESISGVAEAQARAAQAGTKAAEQTAKAANDNAAAASGYAESLASVVKFAAEHQVATLAIIAGTTRAMGGFAGVASGTLATASEATRRYANENDRLGEKASAAAGKVADGLSTAADLSGKASEALGALAGRMTPGSAAAGVLARSLGAIGGFLGPISLLFGAFAVGAVAVERANADLEKLVVLGKQAEKLDVSGPFLKSFTGLGDKLRVEVEGMQSALAQASGLARDRFGQASAIAKLLADIEAATAPLRATKQFDLAQGAEERIRAVLAAMVELEGRGQKLAAIDLGEKVFGTALVERLRRGEDSIAKFVADLQDARNKELIRPEDVTHAVALAKEIEDVKLEIKEASASTLDFSFAALKLDSAWLGVLKIVRDVAQGSARVFEDIVGGTADSINREIEKVRAKISRIETVSIPWALSRGDASGAEQWKAEIERLRTEVDKLTQSLGGFVDRRIDEAAGRIEPPLRLASEAMERLDREAADAANTVPGLAGALNLVAGSAASAAAKIDSVAAGVRALQGLNPNLSGILGYLDKVRETRAVYDATIAKANADFDKTGDEAAKTKAVTSAMAEQTRTLEALNEQRNKPVQDYVRQGQLSQLKDVDRALAQNADNYAAHRKSVEENTRVLAQQAKNPEEAAKIEAQGAAVIATIDNARKLLDAKTKSDAAAAAAKESSKASQSDQFDNALQRTKDETKELEQQAEVLGKNRLEYYKMTEANQLWRAARKAGRQDEAGIADEIDRAADAYARQRTQTDRLTDAHQRMQDAFRDGAGEIADFLDQWVLKGGKFADILKSTTSTLSSGALKGLLTGEGMMGTLLGLAPTEKGQMGGLLGGKSSFLGFDLSDLRKTFRDGFGDGFDNTFGPLLDPAKNAAGESMGFMSSGLGKGLASAGIGASIGYSSGSPLMGIAGGALAGASLGPWGAVVGGAAGLIGGLLGKSEAKKQAKKRIEEQLKAYREAYEQAKPEIEKLRATFRGESLGGVGLQIDAAFQQAVAANKTASQAGDQKTADQIMVEFTQYADRLRWQFIYAFEGTLKEVSAGFGTSGPFAQANAAVASLGESLKAFVADAMKLPEPEKNGPRARAAAQQAALAALDPPKALSDTQSRLAAIQGTASGLTTVLKDLGMSAEQAAAAIRDRTTKAMAALRAEFSADLKARTNEATGKGYLNEVADLVKEREGLLADAKAIGAGTADVSAYFKAAAQKIVDGSELTGDAFTALVRQFPALKGAVVEFGQAIDTAAAKAEAAARALGYQDRAFAAGTDTSTQGGALAAFDRKAAQDRAAEAKAGGQAMADLEKALAAERTAIIKDFAAQAAEAEKAAAEAVQRRVLSAEDRLFAARNDAATLTGKLAELDRQHAQERVEEVAAGGQALAKLEAAQAAERLKIVREAGEAETATRKQALAEAQTFLDGAVKNIRTYLDGLKTGADTALNPGDRVIEAQKQFDAQLALAKGGDRDALGSITTYASSLLDAGRANFASGEGYQSILAAVQQSLGDLPSQVSAEQFIVDAIAKSATDLGKAIAANNPTAIASALDANFGKLDTNLDGKLSGAEFLAGLGPLATVAEQQAAKAVFDRIDQNGDGFIDAMEKSRFDLVAAIQANSPSLIQQALSSEFDKIDTDGSGGLTESEFLAGVGPLATAAEQAAARAYFKAIDEDGNGIIDRVELMRGQLKTAVEANSPGAIELALRTNFDRLDTTANGLLDKSELLAGLGPLATAQQQADALTVFKRIDEDGDGQISKQELIRSQLKAAIEANSPALIQRALSLDFAKLDKLDANTKGALTITEFKAGLGPLATQAEQDAAELLFKSIDENGDGLISATELMRGQLKAAIEANSPSGIAGALKANFDKLDTTMDGRLSKAEFIAGLGPLATKGEQEAARTIFSAIDANGDGLITRTELMHAELKAAIGSNSPTAINAAIKANFDRLDTTMNGRLSQAELLAGLGPLATKAEQQAAKAIFNEIDLNGDGLLTKTELMRTDLRAAIEANSPGLIQKALSLDFSRLDTNTKGALTIAEFKSGLGPLATKAEQDAAERLFEAIDANGDGLLDKTELMRGQLVTALTTNSPANIAAALNANFSKLDTTMNGRLSPAEFLAGLGPLATKAEQDAAKKIFQSIDADGDGQISKLEVVRSQLKAAIEANSPALIQKALSLDFAKLDAVNANTKGALTITEFKAGLGPLATKAEQDAAELLFQSMDANGDGMLSALELMRGQLVAGLQANSPALIASALSANFAMLDTSVNGLLDYKEFTAGLGPLATKREQEDARKLFESIDANGDGQISAQELARVQLKAAIEANSPALIQKALSLDFARLDKIDTNTRGALTVAEFKAGLGPLATKAEQDAAELLFQAIDANGDGLLDKTELMRGQLKAALEANSPAAIATALNTNFTKLDTTMNGRLDEAEFLKGIGALATKEQADAAKKVFDAIDKDGDGQISKLEAVLAELKANLGSPTAIATALNDNFKMLDRTSDKAIDLAEFTAAIGPLATKADQQAAKAVFDSIDADGDKLIDKMELTRSDLQTAIKANSASAIATALTKNFDTLASKTAGGITKAQFDLSIAGLATKAEQAAAYKVFQAIDTDGNGIITKTEAVRAELLAQLKLNDPSKIASALNANFSTLTAATNGRLTSAQLLAGLGPLATKADQATALKVFQSIDADGNNIVTKLEAVSGAIVAAVKANNATAFATEIDKSFTDLDTRVDGLLDKTELAAAIKGLSTDAEIKKANDWLRLMDADNDGMLSKTEVIRARMVEVNANTGATKTAVDQSKTEIKTGNTNTGNIAAYAYYTRKATEATQSLVTTLNTYQKSSEAHLKTSRDALATLKDTGGLQKQQLEALNAQFASSPFTAPNGVKVDSNMIQALNKIVFNTANTVIGQKTGASYTFASGGWVNGPGTGTSDSIGARLSNGEFVVNAASARMNAGLLEAMNDNRSIMLPAMPVPVPVAAAGGEVVAELRALRAEVSRLRTENRAGQEMEARVTKAGAAQVAAAVKENTQEISGHRDDDKRRERKGTGVAGGRGAQAA